MISVGALVEGCVWYLSGHCGFQAQKFKSVFSLGNSLRIHKMWQMEKLDES